jgi:hypothetical protein
MTHLLKVDFFHRFTIEYSIAFKMRISLELLRAPKMRWEFCSRANSHLIGANYLLFDFL